MLKKINYKNVIIIISLILLAIPSFVFAGYFHTLSDRMSRHAIHTESNHEIKFTTPNGIGDAGNVLSLIFDDLFDLSQVDIEDIELHHGQVTGLENIEILNSVANSTDWGCDINTNRIDFTHPVDGSIGDIALDDIIVVKIGDNTTQGINQIINPVLIGSYIFNITTNFGDSGKLAQAIFNDQVGVGNDPIPDVQEPIYIARACPYFVSPNYINGYKSENTTIYINNISNNVTYPTTASWIGLIDLVLGTNIFDLKAMDGQGNYSDTIVIEVDRWQVGDTNGDTHVDDFDLSGIAANFWTDWCYGDFDEDADVDDFDLSGLAIYWNAQF